MSCVQSEVLDKTNNGFYEDILGPVGMRIVNNAVPKGITILFYR